MVLERGGLRNPPLSRRELEDDQIIGGNRTDPTVTSDELDQGSLPVPLAVVGRSGRKPLEQLHDVVDVFDRVIGAAHPEPTDLIDPLVL